MPDPSGTERTAASTFPPERWAELAEDAPDGLAVLDPAGRFLHINRVGRELCGGTADSLIGAPAPFLPVKSCDTEPPGLLDDDFAEHVTTWSPTPGVHREFAYRLTPLSSDPSFSVVAFRDVTDERHRQRRVAAIARTAAKLASDRSLTGILDALASEVLKTDALAGVQILTREESGGGLRIIGSAGFRHRPDFFDRLVEVCERGGTLLMLEAIETRKPVIVPNRWELIRNDPTWEPLHDYLSELKWGSFASIPLIIRGHAAGVLNAFFAVGQSVGQRTMEFLTAMADQAAIAVDYAKFMQHARDVARRDERQRLARDLHDSIVQQVFSISMQAKSMQVLAQRDESVSAQSVRRIADEISLLSQTVLTDLRAMVHELRPAPSAELGGLEEAVRALVDSTTNRTGLRFSLMIGRGIEHIKGELAEDAYRTVSEAIHNVVKHAAASRVVVRLAIRGDRLEATVSDDGRGIDAAKGNTDRSGPAHGYGLATMRERAQRWGGTLTVRPRRPTGTIVRLSMPMTGESPLTAGRLLTIGTTDRTPVPERPERPR